MTVSEEHAAAAEGQPPRVPPGSGSLAAAVLALPPLALVVVCLALAFAGGGVAAQQWEPVAVGMALCLATLAAVGILAAPPRFAWPPLLALGGYVAWSALSLLWSQAPDATVDSVARSALLAGAAVVGASFGGRPRVALALAGALGLGAVILAASAEVELLLGDVRLDDAGRLAWPIDYANASAAALWLALPVLLVFCQIGSLRSLVRGGLGACAGLVLAVGLTAQSRGGVLALVVALAVCTVLVATGRASR